MDCFAIEKRRLGWEDGGVQNKVSFFISATLVVLRSQMIVMAYIFFPLFLVYPAMKEPSDCKQHIFSDGAFGDPSSHSFETTNAAFQTCIVSLQFHQHIRIPIRSL